MLRKFIMNRTGLRNVMIILGQVDNYSSDQHSFIPYFEYEIGKEKGDYTLYFAKTPSAVKYKSWEGITQIGIKWVNHQLQEFQDNQRLLVYNQFIRNDLTVIIKNELQQSPNSESAYNQVPQQHQGDEPTSIDQLINNICDRLEERLDDILNNTEGKLGKLTEKYEMGRIQLTNKTMEDKLAILFICLQNLAGKTDRNGKKGEPLFTKMDLTDIAQILRLHFEHHKGKSMDGVERPLYKLNAALDTTAPSYRNLDTALQKFFFES